LPILL